MPPTAEQDKVRELQRTLYRAAKAGPGRRFHALCDNVYRRGVLERAWELVRANRGAAGIDRQTIAAVEEYGVSRLLDELAAGLKERRWRPLPARRVFIPSPADPQEHRSLSIPAVRDRGCSGGHEDRARADLRGRHAQVLLRVQAQALGARRSPGPR
jgi:RNA-directed DNA polymerase